MNHAINHNKPLVIASAVFFVLLSGWSIYSYNRLNSLSDRIVALSQNVSTLANSLASTTQVLKSAIDQTHSSLTDALSAQQQNVGAIQQQIQNQVGNLSGTLNTLQKLSQTDQELLKKYSKAYFLNENYVPAHLAEIPAAYEYSENKQLLIQTDVLPRFVSMINAASASGIKLYALSAYRSFAEQKALKGEYRVTFGAGTANSFSADQGYSEHQLGTAVDFMTPGLGGSLDGRFDGTDAYKWMVQNAYKYGFVISYPKNNGYFVYEPWHWRFVGNRLATDLHNQGKNFYDLDQRTIDGYLVNVFD